MDVSLIGDTIDEILSRIRGRSSSSVLSAADIKRLEDVLTRIQVVVRREEQNDIHGETELLSWLRDLKNVVNDLTDLVEELSLSISTNSTTTQQEKKMFKFLNHGVKIKNPSKVIKNNPKVYKMIEDLQYIASTSPENKLGKKMERSVTSLDSKFRKSLEMVGREKEKKEIIDQLIFPQTITDTVSLPVVTIVGIAGIGTTKLARLIFEDERVKAHFGSQIWLEKSETLNVVESVQKKVIVKVNHDSPTTSYEKGYLVVIDDLNTEISGADFLKLQDMFVTRGTSGAILITTRNKVVANKITANIRGDKDLANKNVTTVKPRVLQGLNEEESWSLFCRIRKLSEIEVNEDVERKFVMDCGGVPLWIIHAATFVNNRGAVEGFKEKFLEELKFRYYDKLPRIKKLCFAFCSLFPRQHLINVERSIHLLTAEGFLIMENDSVEEKFRGYFNEFVSMSVFKDIEEDERGLVMFCRMQPLMHDLARFVVDGEENITVDPEGDKVHEGVLRASFDFSLDVSRGIPDSLFQKATKLRAILLWKNHTFLPNKMSTSTSTCAQIFETFKLLRMLDLRDMAIITLPSSIGDMKNLRFLDLSHNKMVKLPNAITKLSNLQTLKLSQCYLLKELPKDIDELGKLKHLEIDGCFGLIRMPSKIQNLSWLETLPLFVVSKDSNNLGGLVELACLNNIKGNLEILHLERSTSKLQKKTTYLKEKSLHRLTLKWDHDDERKKEEIKENNTLDCLEPNSELRVLSIVGYKGRSTLSPWLPFIDGLVKLSLFDCSSVKYLPQLDELPNLRFLDLLRLNNLEFIVDNDKDKDKPLRFFPSLEELRISDCPKFTSWWKNKKDGQDIPIFACLSNLHVSYCPKLVCMPLYPGLDQELVLQNSSLIPLQLTIDDGERYNPFSKLKKMEIVNIEENSPQKRWLHHFISLEKLDILEWHGLQRLPQGLNYLNSLERLNIANCEKLDLNLSSNEWEGLKNLRSISIREIPKLNSLPLGLEKVTSLQELEIRNCREITSLPESIGELKSLGRLVIIECHKLTSLPEGLKNIEFLDTLIILDCTLLLPRCQPQTGDDWPQISHIPNIQVSETARDI